MRYIENILNQFAFSSRWYNEVAFRDCRKFWELKDFNIDVVNLGSTSGTYDFNYDGLGIKGSNWAVAPQTVVGDFAILKQYTPHLKKGTVVLYPLCPFTSISGAVDYVEDRCYSFLNLESIPNGHYIRKTRVEQMRNNPILYYPFRSLIADLKYKVFGHKKSRVLTDDELYRDADAMMSGWSSQFKIGNLSLPFTGRYKEVYERGVALLREMSSYCRTNGFRLVILVPPVHKSLAEKFSPSDRDNLIDSFIKAASDGYFDYYNMMIDDTFSNDNALFRSSYYLNEKGSKLYTKYILTQLHVI